MLLRREFSACSSVPAIYRSRYKFQTETYIDSYGISGTLDTRCDYFLWMYFERWHSLSNPET